MACRVPPPPFPIGAPILGERLNSPARPAATRWFQGAKAGGADVVPRRWRYRPPMIAMKSCVHRLYGTQLPCVPHFATGVFQK